uniref:Ig-like domain-containing protein n=1 Tax=Terrapene triunguis TaxID=2587831 RepID=A0A674J2W4_9SAUR
EKNGVSSQIQLNQSGAEIKKPGEPKPGESTKLTCAVSGFDLSSYSMYWVRQAPGKGLDWLIYYYTSSSNSYSPAIQGRFTASKDSSNFYLHMTGLKAEDTAVYYCARDTVRRRRSELRQKPFPGVNLKRSPQQVALRSYTQQGAPGSKHTQPGQAGLSPLSSSPFNKWTKEASVGRWALSLWMRTGTKLVHSPTSSTGKHQLHQHCKGQL